MEGQGTARGAAGEQRVTQGDQTQPTLDIKGGNFDTKRNVAFGFSIRINRIVRCIVCVYVINFAFM